MARFTAEQDHTAPEEQRARHAALLPGPEAPARPGATPDLGANAPEAAVHSALEAQRRGTDAAQPGEARDALSPRTARGPQPPTPGELEPTPAPPAPTPDPALQARGARDLAAQAPQATPEAAAEPTAREPAKDTATQADPSAAPATPIEPARPVLPAGAEGQRPRARPPQPFTSASAPSPPPTPTAPAPAPDAPEAAPSPAVQAQAGAERPEPGDGEGGRTRRPEPDPTTLTGRPIPPGSEAAGGPDLPAELAEGRWSTVSTVYDPHAAWRSEVERVLAARWTVPLDHKVQGLYGVSTVQVCVSRRGRVARAELSEPSGLPGLDHAALAAVPDRLPRPPALRLGACAPHTVRFDFHP